MKYQLAKAAILSTTLALTSQWATAQESNSNSNDLFLSGWQKQLTLSGLYSTGNTSQKSLGFASKFIEDEGPYHQTVTSYFDFNQSNNVTDRRRYGVGYKGDYDVSKTTYVSGFGGFEGDSFGAFNKRFTATGAYGVRLVEDEGVKWSVEAGPAVLFTKALPTSAYETNLTGYAASIFSWQINERSSFSNETKVYVGNEVVVENKSAFSVKMSDALSAQLAFDVLYNRDAPIGRKTTDTITRLGIQYDF
ncbi:MAG TPA: DUF481 domain-containing protein [Emcibacteraceae bacterium]|nr:DUF481 domain-containing protein [Emcibacteraceae bacterium]